MPLTPDQQTYVHQLGALHVRAMQGNREAVGQIRVLANKAQAGDEGAQKAFYTLSVIHWRRANKARFKKAEVFYRRLQNRDPQAWARMNQIAQDVRSGNPDARPVFSTLKAVHRKYKNSAWTGPGQPTIGGYPMPSHHRPGVVFGALAPSTPAKPLLDANALAYLLALIAQARVSVPQSDFLASPDPDDTEAAPGGMPGTFSSYDPSLFALAPANPFAALASQPATRVTSSPATSVVNSMRSSLNAVFKPPALH